MNNPTANGISEKPVLAENATNPSITNDVTVVESSGTVQEQKTLTPLQSAVEEPSISHKRFGRYRIDSLLGRGGYGEVYQAFDEELERAVAIKVIHAVHLGAEQRQAVLDEARIVASLDHQSIVPVYDVGQTETGDCYIVSKLISGKNLADWLGQQSPKPNVAAYWCCSIAAALDHAHRKGLVHRDVKPANILIDEKGRAHLTDFGIAVRENDRNANQISGTPAYMSPEQARGESHRVDQRSDVFSLGVVLFELFARSRPFHSDNQWDLLFQIGSQQAPSLASRCSTVPVEIERICNKALALRASDRYASAKEFALELKYFLENKHLQSNRSQEEIEQRGVSPKGLRSFDALDAGFVELLPGSRSMDGTPDSIRRWKERLTSSEFDYSVGLIYGPSGCGKSSFVKAGLIPRLPAHYLPVYLEATADQTEQTIVSAISRKLKIEATDLSIGTLLSHIRNGLYLRPGQKILLVIDQFEQWLHTHSDYHQTELLLALRQCDGQRIQCILLVRDDFWLSASRFLTDLEIQIAPSNSEMVDLFDRDHALKVLSMFGKSLGKLPPSQVEWTEDQIEFLNQAVDGVATANRIISVRLSLLAEMFKSRPWSIDSLNEVGGALGVGKTFLHETFDAANAPAINRQYRIQIKAILRSLLPEEGSEIKGHSQSASFLASIAGLQEDGEEFETIINLLDRDLRLITLVDTCELASRDAYDPLAQQADQESVSTKTFETGSPTEDSVSVNRKSEYQLAHDYLVPSLRDWLADDQKMTMRGRVELMLADRASMWAIKKERRQLPSIWESMLIRWMAKKSRWTANQREMMRSATKRNVVILFSLMTLTMLVICALRWSDVVDFVLHLNHRFWNYWKYYVDSWYGSIERNSPVLVPIVELTARFFPIPVITLVLIVWVTWRREISHATKSLWRLITHTE